MRPPRSLPFVHATRPFGCLAVGLAGAVVVAACSRQAPLPSVPADRTPQMQRPHWDQVCRVEQGPMLLRTVEEVADTTGLRERLQRSLSPTAVSADESFVDVAVNYEASGILRGAQLLVHNLEEETAQEVAAVLVSAVRQEVRLLAATRVRLRARAVASDGVTLELHPPLRCFPHISHDELDPPRFLGGARVMGGRARSRGPFGGGPWISVRVDLSRTGSVERIVVLGGEGELLDRVREALSPITIDPALLNGEPVSGALELTFRFPEEGTDRLPEEGIHPSPEEGRQRSPGR